MSKIDYFLRFPNQQAAKAQLPEWLSTDDNGEQHWAPKPHCGITEIDIVTQIPVWDYTDPELPVPVSHKAVRNGYWVWIACPHIDEELAEIVLFEPSFAGANYRMVDPA